MLTRQGDAVGLVTFDARIREQMPAASTPSHLQRVLQTLHATRPGGESSLTEVLHEVARRVPRRGLVLVISDFFDDVSALASALHHLRHQKHELVLFHVLAEEEIEFPYSTATRFHDLEHSDEEFDVDPAAIRREYLARFSEYLRELETKCGQVEADYVRLRTRSNYDDALSDYLASRVSR
jgi:uncharacterized protein (DUF58 family)